MEVITRRASVRQRTRTLAHTAPAEPARSRTARRYDTAPHQLSRARTVVAGPQLGDPPRRVARTRAAPVFGESGLDDHTLRPVRDALHRIIAGHMPYPAVVVAPDGRLVAANTATDLLTEGAAADPLEPPVNMLRLVLHPDGMGSRILNLGESLRLASSEGELQLISTLTSFATALDVTLAELHLEAFLPADGHRASPATARRATFGRPKCTSTSRATRRDRTSLRSSMSAGADVRGEFP